MDHQELIARYLSGYSTCLENEQLLSWVKASEENKDVFLDMSKLWYISGKNAYTFDTNVAYNEFKKRVQNGIQDVEIKSVTSKTSRTRKLYVNTVTAAAVVALLIGIVFYFNRTPKIETFANNTGKVEKVKLADGSTSYLNAYASLKAPVKFKKKTRDVEIYGEAFFDVAPDVNKPFVIKASSTTITVVGTSFDVFTDSATGTCVVTVETGKVKVSSGDANEVILLPGQKAVVDESENHIEVSLNKDINYLSWKTGVLTFNNTPLETVVKDIERQYKIEIFIGENIDKSLPLNAKFEQQSLENVLRMIELTFNVKFEKQNTIFVLKKV